MPTVPTYADPQQLVRQQASPNERFQTDAPAEAFNAGQSAQNLQTATLGAEKAVTDVAVEARTRADQVAHIQADTEASKLQTKIQIQVSNMKGQDAFAAPDFAEKAWQEGIQKIRGNLNGPNQQISFDRTSSTRFDSLNKSVQMHVNEQGNAFDDQTTQSGIDQARTAAVINSGDLNEVAKNVDITKQLVDGWAKRKGIPQDSDIYKNKMTQELSATHKDVIQAQITAGLDDAASEYFKANKAGMSAGDVLHTESALENVEVIKQGRSMWDEVSQAKGMKFTDGSLNVEKMRDAVQSKMEESDMSDRRQEQVMKYVKARAAEENVDRHRAVAEHDRMFMNEALDMKKNGIPYDQASSLIGKYGADEYDQAIKGEALAKLYAPPDKSDPGTHIALWQGVQDGKVAPDALDKAMQDGKINVADWFSLRKDLHKQNIEGTDPLQKSAWDRVQAMATDTIGSSDKAAFKTFMYDMHVQGQGKGPEEIIKLAQDRLKDDPKTGWWGETGPMHSRQFESDVKNLDAQNLEWGKLYQDIGKKEASMIGQGATMSTGKPKYNMQDIDAVAAQFGGREQMKPGTPAGDAVRWLIDHNMPVVPSNIQWRIQKTKTAGNAQ